MAVNRSVKATAELLSYIAHRLYLAGFSEGLKPAQWLALRYFSKVNPMASTLTDFARQVGCTKGTASRTVNHLVNRKLLKTRENVEDRRSKFLELTADGRALLKNDPLHQLEEDLAGLEESDHQALQTLLVQMLSGSRAKE